MGTVIFVPTRVKAWGHSAEPRNPARCNAGNDLHRRGRIDPEGARVVGRTATELAERPVAARTVEVLPDPIVVPQVRQMVRDDLQHDDLPATLVDNTLVVLTELLSNSIMHARPVRRDGAVVGIIVRWYVSEGNVRVDVTDGGGPSVPRQSAHSPTDDAGRGLTIVDELARGWTVIRRPGAITVHAELEA